MALPEGSGNQAGDITTFPFQGRHVMPVVADDVDAAGTTSYLQQKASKRSSSPPSKPTAQGKTEAQQSPRPSRLKLKGLHRRWSSSSSAVGSCVCVYAGPKPTGVDGCPLRSCIRIPASACPSVASDLSTSSGRGDDHRVSFSHVQVREYNRQVGDNPSVTSGCPLAIGWKYNICGEFDIETYEAGHDKPREPCERLSSQQREKILTEIGRIPESKIMQGQVQAIYERRLRAETLEQIGGLKNCKSIGPRERLYILKESAARKIDRAKKGTSATREQQKLWDHAQDTARSRSEQEQTAQKLHRAKDQK